MQPVTWLAAGTGMCTLNVNETTVTAASLLSTAPMDHASVSARVLTNLSLNYSPPQLASLSNHSLMLLLPSREKRPCTITTCGATSPWLLLWKKSSPHSVVCHVAHLLRRPHGLG